MKSRFGKFAAAAMIAGLLALPVQAQIGGTADTLDIPEDVNLSGVGDSNVRRPIARVNGTLITATDVAQRVALVMAANEERTFSEEELVEIRRRMLRNLIDETLKIQESEALEMVVTPEEVEETYRMIASDSFGQDVTAMDKYLYDMGSSPTSLKRQIEGEKAWERLLLRNVAPYVNVSLEEVTELRDRMENSQGVTEYRIGEIFLSATPQNETAVLENAHNILNQLQAGASFVGMASQFSEASTAAVGGDLGWIRLEQLQNPQLEAAAAEMLPGQLVGPVPIVGGYSILYLIDVRHIGVSDPRDAILSLKQVSLLIPAGMTEAEASQRANLFTSAVGQISSCSEADTVAAQIGAEVVANDQISMRSLPEPLQDILLQLSVGESTEPFGSLDEGIRVLVLCGRDEPETQATPELDELRSQLEDDRIAKRAQRYLRDLRRDAVIEYN